jgi:uncharacterized repeat protein (TIGR03803 family)
LVQGTDGNFYGTTYGGTYNLGTVFKITPDGKLTTLHSFANAPDGEYPWAGLVEGTNGDFYGTTIKGGANNAGIVFSITPSGKMKTLHTFSGNDGVYPYAGLVQGTDGNFYGTTHGAGAKGGGTVFRITPSGKLKTLYNFCSQSGCTDGEEPIAGLVQGKDGDLHFYGTTYAGGAGYACEDHPCGTIFKITPSGVLTTLHSFISTDGGNPSAMLVQDTNGNFYGTTYNYGANNDGTVFKIASGGGTLTTLHTFAGYPTDGSYSSAGLVQAANGYLYGTTEEGGANGYGTVFKISTTGKKTLTTLHSFDQTDGELPYGGLVLGTDGNFYGTTYGGGAYGYGTIFKITP